MLLLLALLLLLLLLVVVVVLLLLVVVVVVVVLLLLLHCCLLLLLLHLSILLVIEHRVARASREWHRTFPCDGHAETTLSLALRDKDSRTSYWRGCPRAILAVVSRS